MVFGRAARRINRILIVEDEPLVAFDTEYALAQEGFKIVATVDRVADAIRIVGEQDVDLALLDVELPDGSGVEIARAAATRGVIVIFATGTCPGDAEGLAHGCLGKPFTATDVTRVVAVVERVLAGRKPGRLPAAFTLFEAAFAGR